jgi:hypothetical protein
MSGVRARQRYTGACRPKLLRFISRGIVAANFWWPSSETNPLREAALSQNKGRVAATRFVSRKN